MKRKLKNILFFIIIGFIIIYSAIILKNKVSDKTKNDTKDLKYCEITVDAEGNVLVKEFFKVDIKIPENAYIYYTYATHTVTPSIYCNDMDESIMQDMKVIVDGKVSFDFENIKYLSTEQLKAMGLNEYSNFFKISQNNIQIYNLDYKQHYINLEYKLNPKMINQYSNISILKVLNNKNFMDYKIIVYFPQGVNTFATNTKYAKVKKVKNDHYEINMVDTQKIIDKDYTEIKLDNSLIVGATQLNKEYNFINKIGKEENFSFKYLLTLSIITVILYILTRLLTQRRIIYKNPIKTTKIVLEPIFAESIVDGKIGTKELIMSCIMDLIYRKNIEIVEENEAIQINNMDNVTEYERKIIDLIFDRRLVISFKELKKMFDINHVRTIKFNKKLKRIKEEINEKFLNEGIYSNAGEKILKYIKIISLILALNFIPLTLSIMGILEIYHIQNMIVISVFLGAIIVNIKPKEKFYIEDLEPNKVSVSGIGIIVMSFIVSIAYVAILITIFESNILMCLISIAVLIMNIITLKKTTIHCLTNKGTVEFNKAYALKTYIKNYSLMEQREMDGIKIWDRYLAYACAFGISTRITEKIDEDAIKFNSILQKLDEIN